MRYTECKIIPKEGESINEVLIALLAEEGFESFMENDNGSLSSYIPTHLLNIELKHKLCSEEYASYIQTLEFTDIEDRNWNAEWERAYDMVRVDDSCVVRAPFHDKPSNVEFDIVIMPQMSFGTAHHETTLLMLKYMLETPLKGMSLLDMGSGTAVLAILARMKGANPVTAIDNDDWAYRNAIDNVKANNFPEIEVLLGDSTLLKDKKYDIIFANINRNVLLNDMSTYTTCLNKNGKLFLSGFYQEDLPLINEKAKSLGLILQSSHKKNNWTAAYFSV